MAVKRLLTEFGMGASLRRQDYTQAAVRGVKNALWHNSINLAELFGKAKTDMLIEVEVEWTKALWQRSSPMAKCRSPWSLAGLMCRGQMACQP